MSPHVTTTRHLVGMVDVDLVQIHFASYLSWVDHAFSELLEELGRPLQAILAAGGGTPVVDVHCSFLFPVGLGDRLTARHWVEAVGTSSFTVRHEFSCRDRLVAVVDTKHVWISTGGGDPRPRPLPAWLIEASASSASSATFASGPTAGA